MGWVLEICKLERYPRRMKFEDKVDKKWWFKLEDYDHLVNCLIMVTLKLIASFRSNNGDSSSDPKVY